MIRILIIMMDVQVYAWLKLIIPAWSYLQCASKEFKAI